MVRYEDRISANRLHNQSWKDSFTTSRNYTYTLAVVHLQLHCSFRMNFNIWFRALFDEKSDAPSLVTRKILIDNPATGQNQREFIIGSFLRRLVLNRMEFGFAIRMIETLFKQSRCTRMIFRGAW